jgi:hypothetical protein
MRMGLQQELSMRDVVDDEVQGNDHGITPSHTLIANKDLLQQDSFISQLARDPLKALGHDESDYIDGKREGSRVRSTYFNEDTSNCSLPATRVGTYADNVEGCLGLGYDSRLSEDISNPHFFHADSNE